MVGRFPKGFREHEVDTGWSAYSVLKQMILDTEGLLGD